MKVVHLSTHDTRGGAAFSAWRLHQGLRQIGVESRMLVRTKHSDSEHVHAVNDGPTIATWFEKIATPWLQRQMPPDSAWTTVGCIDSFIDSHPWIAEADVLHLHWVAEWLSAAAVAKLAALGKPLLWTFHDVWPVSCGVHFAGSNSPENDDWQTGAALPQPMSSIAAREFQRKLSLLADLPIQAITPSQWLGDLVHASHIGKGWQPRVIPYGIDTQTFAPGDSASIRERIGLPAKALLLLFGCQALNERRKGYAELSQALRLAASHHAQVREAFNSGAVQLLLFGADKPDASELPLPMIHLGFVKGETAMADLYRAADAYLCPSLEDNLPNTVLESLACGTPVIGFTTGGLPDVVKHERTGLLATCGDVDGLANSLTRFVIEQDCREHLKTETLTQDKTPFAIKTQATAVEAVYQTLLKGSKPEARPAVTGEAPKPSDLLRSETSWLLEAAANAQSLPVTREQKLQSQLDAARQKLSKKQEPKPLCPPRPWWKPWT